MNERPSGDGRTAVYHLFDADMNYLYIGMTDDPVRRFTQHASKAWWLEVDPAHTLIFWFATREEAGVDEMRQVAIHRPPHNTVIVGPRNPIVGPVAWDHDPELTDWDQVMVALDAIDDPAERARAAGMAMRALEAEQQVLKWARQACVVEMRRTMSLAEIGRQVGLHRNRVQQIGEGRTGGNQGAKAEEA
jgi:predicted GIY-YIG superfamily endonuclease